MLFVFIYLFIFNFKGIYVYLVTTILECGNLLVDITILWQIGNNSTYAESKFLQVAYI